MGNSCAGRTRSAGPPRRRSAASLAAHGHYAELGLAWAAADALVLARCRVACARLRDFHRGSGGDSESRSLPASSILANPRAFLSAIESDLELVLALPLAVHSAAAAPIRSRGVPTGDWDVAVDRLGRMVDYIHSVTAGISAGNLDGRSDVVALVDLKVREVAALLEEQLDALRETYLPVILDERDAAQRAAVHAQLRAQLREWNDVVDPHLLRTAPRDLLAQHARYAARQPWYGDMVLAGVHVLSGKEWEAVAPLLPRVDQVLPKGTAAGQDDPVPLQPEDFDESSDASAVESEDD